MNIDDIKVPGEGPKDAKIVIVGEAGGKAELQQGRPFVGPSGRTLNALLARAGIKRHECYVTNVVKSSDTNVNNWYHDRNKKKPKFELNVARKNVQKEINEINPNLVIACGAEALKALKDEDGLSIGDWRGSVIETKVGKTIPIYHPAMLLRQWMWAAVTELDLKRARDEAQFPEIHRKERKLIVNPELWQVREFIEECKNHEYLSFDIETSGGKNKERFIDCLGLAYSDDVAMSIPLTHANGEPYWSLEDEMEVWKLLCDVMSDPSVKKIAQNGQYDIIYLERAGVPIRNFWFDTMNAANVIYPEFPKALSFLVSIYTDEPFYKDTIKSDRWIYNAKDAALTYEVAMAQLQDMEDFGVTEFYFTHVHPLLRIYVEVHEQGVRIDEEKLEKAKEKIEGEINELQDELNESAGRELNVNSPKQMREYLYDTLGFKPRYNKAGNPTANADTIKEFYRKTGRRELEIILEIRQLRKILSTYLNAPYDADGRMRCSYNVSGTETGRLSSSSSVDGTGTNLQNIPKGVCREIFIPDDGCKMVAGDLSQAENRVVAYLTRDENMLGIVNSDSGDIHTENAAKIFNKDPEKVSKQERQLGKRITHGCLLPEAEVLTPGGWVALKDLQLGVKTAQFNLDTNEIEFVVPQILEYDYDGPMYAVDSNGHKNVYSPEHRIPYVRKRNFQQGSRDIVWKCAEELSSMNRPGMVPVSGYLEPDNPIMMHPDNARVLAMIQADGSIEPYGGIRLAFKKERKQERCEELLERVGIPYTEHTTKEGYRRFFIKASNAKSILYYLGRDKTFGNWILQLHRDTAKALIEEVQYWDGSRSHDTRWTYNTTNEQNAIAIQTLAHLCGNAATLQTMHTDKHLDSYRDGKDTKLMHRVSIMSKQHAGLRKEHWSTIHHTGKIYCLSVPSEAFLVRYNNSIHVTMNSNYRMGPLTFARFAELPTKEAKRLLQLYYDTYPRLKMWHKEIENKIKHDRTLRNPFGRRRLFMDRISDTTFRDATSYLPQSTVADAIHRATYQIYSRLPWPATVLMQLHDSITVQCPENMVDDVVEIMTEELECPFVIDDQELSIPADIDIGDNWNECG